MKKVISTIIAILIVANLCFVAFPATNNGISCNIKNIEKNGNAELSILYSTLTDKGYATGDLCTLSVKGKTYDVPLVESSSDVAKGRIALCHVDKGLELGVSSGSFASLAKAKIGDKATITLKQKEGFFKSYNFHSLGETNNRSDYLSDEAFANFREIHIGSIAAGVLYRSSDPVDNVVGRASFADILAKKAGIKTVINLADSDKAIKKFFLQPNFDSPFYNALYGSGNVIALNMPYVYNSDEFKSKVKSGIEFMINRKGPYLIHCTLGRDRTGFVLVILESFMGGSLKEIEADYVKSYENYFNVQPNSAEYRMYLKYADKMITSLCGANNINEVNLQKVAKEYLAGCGLNEGEQSKLAEILSSPVEN